MAALHTRVNKEIREVVFGIEDSLVSTMGVVTGVAGGTQTRGAIIVAGLVIIVVEAVSMAAGSYLSSKSKRESDEAALRKIREFIKTKPEHARSELEEIYTHRGFDASEVALLMKKVISNPKLWAEEMNAHHSHIDLPQHEHPGRNAWYMGISYIVAGIIPIAPYFLFSVSTAIPVGVALTAIGLFCLGVVKAKIVQRPALRSGVEMLIISLVAAGIGYGIGRVAGNIFGA